MVRLDGDGVGDNLTTFPTMQVKQKTVTGTGTAIIPMHFERFNTMVDRDGDGYGDNRTD